MCRLAIALLFALPLLAQPTGAPVSVSAYPSSQPTILKAYDGGTPPNPIYVGYAAPFQNYTRITGNSITSAFRWTKAATTLTNIVVATNVGTVTTSTAHGLTVGNPVTVSGATVDTDLNATYYVQTVGSTTTFTITTASVADATYTDATLVLSTNAPLTTQPIWAINKKTYSTNSQIADQWAGGSAKSYTFIWDNRAVTTGATKITYQ